MQAVQAVQAVQAELVAAAYPHSTVVLLAELVPLAVKLCQEQPVHLAAPVLEPSVLQVQVAVWRPTRLAVRAELVLALLVLPAALVQLARRELQVQVAVWRPTRLAVRAELVLALLVLALLVLPAALVQLVRRELQVQEELLARMALGERLVLLAWRELQESGVRPERARSGRQPWR